MEESGALLVPAPGFTEAGAVADGGLLFLSSYWCGFKSHNYRSLILLIKSFFLNEETL